MNNRQSTPREGSCTMLYVRHIDDKQIWSAAALLPCCLAVYCEQHESQSKSSYGSFGQCHRCHECHLGNLGHQPVNTFCMMGLCETWVPLKVDGQSSFFHLDGHRLGVIHDLQLLTISETAFVVGFFWSLFTFEGIPRQRARIIVHPTHRQICCPCEFHPLEILGLY